MAVLFPDSLFFSISRQGLVGPMCLKLPVFLWLLYSFIQLLLTAIATFALWLMGLNAQLPLRLLLMLPFYSTGWKCTWHPQSQTSPPSFSTDTKHLSSTFSLHQLSVVAFNPSFLIW